MALVEDYSVGSTPPGVNGSALFIVLRRQNEAAGCVARRWDFAPPLGTTVCSTTSQVVQTMLEFPQLQITGSNKVSNDVVVTTNYGRPGNPGGATDVGDNAWVNNGSTTADTAAITHIDIYQHIGPSDPGRLRYATCGGGPPCANLGTTGSCCWQKIRQIAYTGGPVTNDSFTVDCGDRTEDTWVAAGISFVGGSCGSVESAMVGRAVQLQCDPATAIPQPKPRPGAPTRRDDRSPSRGSGGR
jgi:hypothetical protein